MAADYRKFKTPFYEIEVGDPSWKRKVKLPHHILRLVDKVEIVENMMVDDHQQPTEMTISFIEGSREPASPDYKMGTSGLYQIPIEGDTVDMDISGSLTNRSGVITDLRFSGSSGITFLTEQEKKTGKVDNALQKNVIGKNTTRKYKSENSAPMFLFQQRNKVKVTWGYLEAPELKRSMMLSITAISTNFPESGMPTTTIKCTSSVDQFNQIAAKRGIPFAKKIKVDKDGAALYIFEDLKTDELIQDMAKKTGMRSIISKNLLNNTVDKDKQKMLVAGESPHQFFLRLAQASGCYYEILPDPKTGIETIYFISKKDMESGLIVKDKELLNWKGPGSILKSVNVSADFSGLLGNSQKGITKDGETQDQDTMLSEQLLVNSKSSETNKKQEFIPADPVRTNANPAVKGFVETILENQYTGTVNYCPADSTQKLENTAQAQSDANSRLVYINFNTIGHPKFMPGVMEITGIGVRYSGKYRVINVTHIIDSNGYSTSCQGMSSFLGSGGVKVPELQQAKDSDEFVNEKLFEYKKSKGG